MRKRCVSSRRGLAGILTVTLTVLVTSLAAQAGTFTIVDLPATGTDQAIGISSDKVYTHAFDFGTNAPVTINSVVFEQGPTDAVRATFDGTSQYGYGYSLGDTRASVNLAVHAGSDPAPQVDGSSAGLLRDMMFHSNSKVVGEGLVLTLSDLVPGTVYSTRFYYRRWSAAPSQDRTITFQGDGGHHGVFSDTIDIELDGGNAHYLDYTFTADDTDVELRFLTNDYNNGVHLYGITNEMGPISGSAMHPNPADKAVDIPCDMTLAWQAAATAATHNVYFGTDFSDVNDGVALVSPAQDANSYDPGGLEFGTTYYWRVDEVGAPPDSTVVKGAVWSFTTEPVARTLTNLTVTDSGQSIDLSGPENVINGSGLDENDLHSNNPADMWLSAGSEGQPAWIQFEFDQRYLLADMLVWNANQNMEALVGMGIKDVLIETSIDGETWTVFDADARFNQGTGLPGYAANTIIDFSGTVARFVKLTAKSNWGGLVEQYGLSEVRFSYIPTYARLPQPEDGTALDGLPDQLSWRSGRQALEHEVYLGTDVSLVEGEDVSVLAAITQDAELGIAGQTVLGQDYFWKVVETNDLALEPRWSGPVWSFSTPAYLVVDDFESYNDDDNLIFEAWADGYEIGSNGSLVGNLEAPFAERTIIYGGRQSMPFVYDNTGGKTSEATRTFDAAQDWTVSGVQGLSLWFYGAADNTGQLYVKINNTKVVYAGDAGDLKIAAWMPWTIDLASTGANLQKITKLAIGIEGSGAAGKLFIDDIRLCLGVGATVMPVDPGTAGLVAHYKFDGDARDSAGTHHGTPSGSPGFTAGKVGQALNMTADLQYVAIPYAADLSMNSFTVAVWVNLANKNSARGILGTRFSGDNTFDLKVEAGRIHSDLGDGTAWLNTAVDVLTPQGGNLSTGEWHHIVCAVDDAADAAKLYVNGALAATVTVEGTPLFMKTGQELRIGVSSGTEYMQGMIDDLRIYNRAISEAEAAALAGRPGPVQVAP